MRRLIESATSSANVDAIRYVDNAAKEAITFFPNKIFKGTAKSVDWDLRVPFGGFSSGTNYVNGEFHVIHQRFFALTIREGEIRGTEIVYNY